LYSSTSSLKDGIVESHSIQLPRFKTLFN
jgi:hypothetical protein